MALVPRAVSSINETRNFKHRNRYTPWHSVHPEHSKHSIGLWSEEIWVHSIVLYSYTYDIYVTIFMKDNQYYASRYQHSAKATLVIRWQCVLRQTGKTSQALFHLPLNFTVDGTALVSTARKTDHKTYMQYVVLLQYLAFSRVINVWRILYNSRSSTIHSTQLDYRRNRSYPKTERLQETCPLKQFGKIKFGKSFITTRSSQ